VIKRFIAQNFRCLRRVEFELAPLTILVGPNGSGKSALLSALDPEWGIVPTDTWQHASAEITRVWTLDSGTSWSVKTAVPAPSVTRSSSTGAPHRVSTQHLRLDLEHLRAENQVTRQPRLDETGDNLANVFDSLSRKEQIALGQQLCSLVPLFTDVEVTPSENPGWHRLRFQDRWNHDVWYSPREVSDGTMLLLAFLTLQYQNPPADLITVEEPERALHPYLLAQLVDLLRRLGRGEIGKRPVQIVLATHSPELLEYAQPEEVRFLGRDKIDGATTISSVAAGDPDWKRYFGEYEESLRQAWLSGGLGGVPGT
jgi:predicted ATPase